MGVHFDNTSFTPTFTCMGMDVDTVYYRGKMFFHAQQKYVDVRHSSAFLYKYVGIGVPGFVQYLLRVFAAYQAAFVLSLTIQTIYLHVIHPFAIGYTSWKVYGVSHRMHDRLWEIAHNKCKPIAASLYLEDCEVYMARAVVEWMYATAFVRWLIDCFRNGY
jgi:hypothetical protein